MLIRGWNEEQHAPSIEARCTGWRDDIDERNEPFQHGARRKCGVHRSSDFETYRSGHRTDERVEDAIGIGIDGGVGWATVRDTPLRHGAGRLKELRGVEGP